MEEHFHTQSVEIVEPTTETIVTSSATTSVVGQLTAASRDQGIRFGKVRRISCHLLFPLFCANFVKFFFAISLTKNNKKIRLTFHNLSTLSQGSSPMCVCVRVCRVMYLSISFFHRGPLVLGWGVVVDAVHKCSDNLASPLWSSFTALLLYIQTVCARSGVHKQMRTQRRFNIDGEFECCFCWFFFWFENWHSFCCRPHLLVPSQRNGPVP